MDFWSWVMWFFMLDLGSDAEYFCDHHATCGTEADWRYDGDTSHGPAHAG